MIVRRRLGKAAWIFALLFEHGKSPTIRTQPRVACDRRRSPQDD
jgi:hypothetical protein